MIRYSENPKQNPGTKSGHRNRSQKTDPTEARQAQKPGGRNRSGSGKQRKDRREKCWMLTKQGFQTIWHCQLVRGLLKKAG